MKFSSAIFVVLLVCQAPTARAALLFEPAAPWVAAEGQLRIRAVNAVKPLTWHAEKGAVSGFADDLGILYSAPPGVERALDTVSVIDAAGNTGTVSVLIQPRDEILEAFKPENAQALVYGYDITVGALAHSEDGQILWVGTSGDAVGVQKRDAATGRLLRWYRKINGLGSGEIYGIKADGNGGVWVAELHMLLHLDAAGNWTRYHAEYRQWDQVTRQIVTVPANSILPKGAVQDMAPDGRGGLWIGTQNGLVHWDGAENWALYHGGQEWNSATEQYDIPANSVLQGSNIECLLLDESGGLWIGGRGLYYLDAAGNWTVYSAENSGLPENSVTSLALDGNGGVWAGTSQRGLARLDAAGHWTEYHAEYRVWDNELHQYVITPANSMLPSNSIRNLSSDGNGGLLVGTEKMGLAYLDAEGHWLLYHTDNSKLPSNYKTNFSWSDQGDLWIGGSRGLVHLDVAGNPAWHHACRSGEDAILSQDLTIPTYLNSVTGAFIDDGAGGLWTGNGQGLFHLEQTGVWTRYGSGNSALPAQPVVSLALDGSGGVLIGTKDGALTHRDSAGNWSRYGAVPTVNEAEYASILEFGRDKDLWAGLVKTSIGSWAEEIVTGVGLAHRDKAKNWTFLPMDTVYDLQSDIEGGVWLAGGINGLIHLDAAGNQTLYTSDNSGLPTDDSSSRYSIVEHLIFDNEGDLWMGGNSIGLARLDHAGNWTSYHAGRYWDDADKQYEIPANSGLPGNSLTSIKADGAGGLWMGIVGIHGSSLTYKDRVGGWTVYDGDNSDLSIFGDYPVYSKVEIISAVTNRLWIKLSNLDNLLIVRSFHNPIPQIIHSEPDKS